MRLFACMISRRFAFLLLLVAAPCCGGKVPTDEARVSTVESRDTRFVGTWVLEDPNLDSIHAQAWTFAADGTMSLVDQINSGPDLGAMEHGSTSCHFGETWSSEGSTTLKLTVNCTDGRSRTAALAFPEDASKNSQIVQIQIVDVDGESGWARPQWSDWQLSKCTDVASCTRGWHR
jgi:hypothetical protein